MIMWDHILKKTGLRKDEKYDNSKAIVPAHYFSSLMLDVERRYLKDNKHCLATFEFEGEFELTDNVNEFDGEFNKGGKLFVAIDRHLLHAYPDKVHLFMGGSGGYYSYYLGIASVLQEHFKLDNVTFSGVSGGTLVNLFLALNMDVNDVFQDWNVPLLNKVAEFKFGALFNWNQTCLEHFQRMVPDDAHERVKGRYYVFTTEFYYNPKNWKCRMIGDWENNDELGDAILASCQIPLLLGGSIATTYRDQRFIDGYFTYLPELNEHDMKMPSIKIYANSWRPYKLSWLWCWTSVEWHKEIFKWGRQDAEKNLKYFKEFLMLKDNVL
jgi:hypothetical protein